MSSTTMASRLLDAADLLLLNGKRSNAFRRRAVSTAYYAVFHALAKLCADYLTRSARRQSDEYARVYRALEHGSLKNAFGQEPLSDNERLSELGAIVVRLQAERHRADYMPPILGVHTVAGTQELIDLAREAVASIEALGPEHEDCRVLVTSLHFRRSSR